MSESFVKIPTDIVKSHAISNLEFRVLANIVILSTYNDGHSFLGSFKLSDMCGIGRAALRKALSNLEAMKLIKITQRGNFSRSNDILLTMSEGLAFLQNGGSVKSTLEVDLKDSPQVDLNDSRVALKDSPVYLKEPPYKDIDLNNIYLNNNRAEVDLKDSPKKERSGSKKATDDVASVRSMPCQQADDELARKEVVGSQCELTDYILVDDFKQEFEDILPLITLFKIGNEWGVRPFMRLPERAIRAIEIRSFFEKRGQKITFFEAKTHKNGEIIMDLAIKTAS